MILVDKSDISEEVTRLKEHIRNFKKLMASSKPNGKKLDFYAQELLREVNTIASKIQNAEAQHFVVDAKSQLERMKEQAQNIE